MYRLSFMVTSRDVLTELLALAPRLERLRVDGIDQRLTSSRLRLLALLADGGPLTSAELARRMDVTPRAVTALVDGLESRGLARRRPHPSDRRATLVEVSPAGARTWARLDRGYGRLADELLAGTSDRQLAAGMAVLRRVGSRLDDRRS
jgi:DNA-binding MarR family transcriptional regulator